MPHVSLSNSLAPQRCVFLNKLNCFVQLFYLEDFHHEAAGSIMAPGWCAADLPVHAAPQSVEAYSGCCCAAGSPSMQLSGQQKT
jgi:hypothetical protein